MSQPDVVVIDYGVGNLLSVRRALEHCGAAVAVSADPDEILHARRLVLPGVGAFADGMAELRARKLDSVVREAAKNGTALLGICLGMQMLLDESEEFGTTSGLGLIPGRVVPISAADVNGRQPKVPHIGWNALEMPNGRVTWEGTVLQDVIPYEATYFVHSFTAIPSETSHRIANCQYGGIPIAAVIGQGNVCGCQFHPEKSGPVGLKILRRFVRL